MAKAQQRIISEVNWQGLGSGSGVGSGEGLVEGFVEG